MADNKLNAVFRLEIDEERAEKLKRYLESSPNVKKDYYDKSTGERAYSLNEGLGGRVLLKEGSHKLLTSGLTIDSLQEMLDALKGE